MNIVEMVLVPLILIAIPAMVFFDLRYTLRKRASRHWPTVDATIESAVVGFQGPLSFLPRVLYRVHFIYSYDVQGTKYGGRFYMLTDGKNSAEEFRQALVGKRILARYDNRRAELSFLAEETLMGKRVMQGPSWTYR